MMSVVVEVAIQRSHSRQNYQWSVQLSEAEKCNFIYVSLYWAVVCMSYDRYCYHPLIDQYGFCYSSASQ